MSDLLTPEVRAAITAGRLAHLVTLEGDGTPHVTLVWVGLDGDEIVAGHLALQHKVRNMQADARVALSFETAGRTEHGLDHYLVVNGRARITEGGAPELLQRLAHVYLGPDVVFPPFPDPPAGFVTRITPESLGGVGPWTA